MEDYERKKIKYERKVNEKEIKELKKRKKRTRINWRRSESFVKERKRIFLVRAAGKNKEDFGMLFAKFQQNSNSSISVIDTKTSLGNGLSGQESCKAIITAARKSECASRNKVRLIKWLRLKVEKELQGKMEGRGW